MFEKIFKGNSIFDIYQTPSYNKEQLTVMKRNLCLFQGLFVALVQNNYPAALAGLRFGDQVLQINGKDVAGWDTDKAHKFLKEAPADRITFAVRDRWV